MPRLWKPLWLPRLPRRLGQRLIVAGVTTFGLALLTLVLMIAYVGSYTPGLGPVGWLLVGVGALHLVRSTRRGEPLVGMRYAVLCAALPVAQVTQAFITTTVLFGGLAALLLIAQWFVALLPRRRWWP